MSANNIRRALAHLKSRALDRETAAETAATVWRNLEDAQRFAPPLGIAAAPLVSAPRRHALWLAAAAALLLTVAGLGWGYALPGRIRLLLAVAGVSQQAQQQHAPYVFHAVNKGDVMLHVTVLDNKDHNVGGLTQNDFTILENGSPRKIDFFAEEDAPVSIGILVDHSGSMRGKQEKVQQAALNFVQTSNPQDEVFVVNFNDEVKRACDFTNQIPVLQSALTSTPKAATAIYDALTVGFDYEAAHAKNDKRALLLITDGYDNASRHGIEETLKQAQALNGPLVYGIGLLDPDDIPEEHKQGEKVLKQFADATGGMAYFPADLAEVDTITHLVAEELRAQYTIIYHSNQTGAGYHGIQVHAGDAKTKNLKVRTRAGYYVDN